MADAAAVADQPCTHEIMTAHVDVGRISPDAAGMPKAFVAEVHVSCAPEPEGCGVAFTFPGVACGLSFDEPRVSVDGTELRAPIRPVDAAAGFGTGMPSVGLRLAVE